MVTTAETMSHPGQDGLAFLLRRAADTVIVLGIAAFVVALSLAAAAIIPTFVGYNSYVITSQSMSPTISAGSVVVSRPVRAEALAVGDVITFRRPEQPKTNITHSILGINYQDGRRVFLTKGDANNAMDTDPVRVQGEVDTLAYSIPLAGYVLEFAKSTVGLLALLGLALLGLATRWDPFHRSRSRDSSSLRDEAIDSHELRDLKRKMDEIQRALADVTSRGPTEATPPNKVA